MNWNFDLKRLLARCRYFGRASQSTGPLTLLREVQDHCGGSLPQAALEEIAGALGVKCSFLAAIVRTVSQPPAGRSRPPVRALLAAPTAPKRV